jgi:hypothetical protein
MTRRADRISSYKKTGLRLHGTVTTLIEGEGTPEQRIQTFTYDVMNRLKTATVSRLTQMFTYNPKCS